MNLFQKIAILLLVLFGAAAPAQDLTTDPAVIYANKHAAGGIAYREGYFGQDERRLHFVEAGTGPLIILYHGFPSNWFSWYGMMEKLKHNYRVVAVDGLGAGLSAKPQQLKPYRIDRLARQLDQLARHINGDRRFILIGHDWGAALSLAYAQAYPKRLKAVVGMSAPPYNLFLDLVTEYPEQRAKSAYMQRFRNQTFEDVRKSGFAPRFASQVYGELRDAGHLTPEQAEILSHSVGRIEAMNGGMNWYRANLPSFEKLHDARRWPKHKRIIEAPALLIWGERDQTFLPIFLDLMPIVAPDLSTVRLADVGHMAPIEKSDESMTAIMAFLAEKAVAGD
jgi:epoxide hydrolase 4